MWNITGYVPTPDYAIIRLTLWVYKPMDNQDDQPAELSQFPQIWPWPSPKPKNHPTPEQVTNWNWASRASGLAQTRTT